MDIPVYLFTGFLDGGKTRFIQETLEDARFNTGIRTLLLVCEEGEEEYRPDCFSSSEVAIQIIDDPSALTKEHLRALLKQYRCRRVMVEYNGMWLLDDLYNALPDGWMVAQEFFFADANTILTYNSNMRNLVGDKLKSCELAVFNRFPKGADKLPFHQLVRTFSSRTDIAYEDASGNVEYDNIKDPLPFDLQASVVDIGDESFALWYRDLSEDMDKYQGKTIHAKVRVIQKRTLGADEMIIGRDIMTCCAADVQFAGLICRFIEQDKPQNGAWIELTAKIQIAKHKAYHRTGPVLSCQKWNTCQPPEQEIATYY